MLPFTLRTLALGRAPRMEPRRVEEVRRARLRALVRRVVEGSAFYREKYGGIDPDRFELADLPPTTKAELMAHFDAAVTDPAVRRAEVERFIDDPANEGRLFRGRYVVSHTSGSQGQPMLLVQDRGLLELFFGLQMIRGKAGAVGPIEAVRRLLDPARLAVVTLKRGFYPSAAAFEHIPTAVRRYVRVLRLSQTDADVVDRLNAFRPTALTAYAGVLEMLALEAEAGRLRLAPELTQVTNNSELLTDRARARVEAAFGRHVLDNYATGECPFLTNGCRTDSGAHVNADWAILEVVDEANRPVPDGTPGKKVLITNLANTVQPFLRYEVGDVVTMAAGPCHCGSRLPRVERVGGRAADLFWIRDGQRCRPLINFVFSHAFEYLRDVREWQAIQTGRNEVLVRLEPLPGAAIDAARARQILDRELASFGYHGLVRVDFEVVPRLDADPKTGKFRRIISLVGPPDGYDRGPSIDPLGGLGPESVPALDAGSLVPH